MRHSNSYSGLLLLALSGSLAACSSNGDSSGSEDVGSNPGGSAGSSDSGDRAAKPGDSGIPGSEFQTALQALEKEVPNASVRVVKGRLAHLAGPLAQGAAPDSLVESFIEKRKALFGVKGSELAARGAGSVQGMARTGAAKTVVARAATPVMYDPATGDYRFLLYRFEQQSNGIPVMDAGVDVVVRNEAPYTVVRTASSTRDLSAFVPTLGGKQVDFARAKQHLAKKAPPLPGALGARAERLNEPEVVIWAGTDSAHAAPKLATRYVASVVDAQGRPDKVQVVTDLETGALLFKKSIIVFEDITGNVRGLANADANGIGCSEATSQNLPYATVTATPGDLSASADATGHYSLAFPDSTPASLTSTIRGTYFSVTDVEAARNSSLSADVVPPQTQDFAHNDPTSELSQAQVNAYVHANRVRDWILSFDPEFPSISTETALAISVNNTENPCPGNAWFDPNNTTLNFCQAGSGYGNTAFGTIVYHEYAHRVVEASGAGQDEFGEGMGDALSALLTDSNLLGVGFNSCSEPLRNAENTCQYSDSACSSCGSEMHACGQLLAGAVWSVRNAMQATYPDTYRQLLPALAIASMRIHQGSGIGPDLVIDYLTLDDDDADIGNGTPHRAEICAGFGAHGFACPALTVGLTVTPTDVFSSSGMPGGPFIPATGAYTVRNLGPDAFDFSVASDVPWLAVQPASGSLANGATLPIVVSLNAQANALPTGLHNGKITFTNTSAHLGDVTLPVTLNVDPFHAVYGWALDTDPGWARDGAWGYGAPQGVAGDPTSGRTGASVLGTNLDGSYANDIASETSITTGAIDCSGLSDVHVKFWRWLQAEISPFDRARVYVSTDNTNWTPVWENTGIVMDAEWTQQAVDISAVADGQPTVYVRWALGPTDSTLAFGGWNLDDVEIWALGSVPNDVEASLRVNSDWGAGYCVSLEVKNNDAAKSTKSWSVLLDLKGTTTYTAWGGDYSGTSGNVTVTSTSWNSVIPPNANVNGGFCANRPTGDTTVLPVVTSTRAAF